MYQKTTESGTAVERSCDKEQTTMAIPRRVTQIVALIAVHCVCTSIHGNTPDPVALVNGVASARNGIASGQIELMLIRRVTSPPKHGVDRIRLTIAFDGTNRRCDQFVRELIMDGSGPDGGKARREKLDELEGDREQFVRLGLGQWRESHYCTIYDGTRLLRYDGESAVVADPGRGSFTYVFDPRIIGLTSSFFVEESVDHCFALKDARTVSLIGQEMIQGQHTWHVRVLPKREDEQRDFWIALEDNSRVLRYERHRLNSKLHEIVQSEYAGRDALPTKVQITEFRDGHETGSQSFLQASGQFAVSTDPRWWTLAGLNMSVGAPVSDVRIHQRIGYWNGTGLSKDLRQGAKVDRLTPPPHSGRLLDVAKEHPKSDLALDAVSWLIVNTPDGPDVDSATDILIRDHIGDKRLGVVCDRLRDSRSENAERLLRAVLESNSQTEPRALACFALASNLKNKSEQAAARLADGKPYALEAQALFERILEEYADVKHANGPLGELARPHLNELRHLEPSSLAPDILGRDIDNRPFKLTDYRGRVVVLTFSANWCSACVAMYPHERSLMNRYKDRPFTILSVSGDGEVDTLRESIQKGDITWRCWWDGPKREISEAWNVTSWPAVYVLDGDGVIRFKNVHGQNLDAAVRILLDELNQ